MHWEHGEEAHVAYVPALGIESLAPTLSGLRKKLSGDVRAALFRRGVARSLRKLVELKRTTRVPDPAARWRATAAWRPAAGGPDGAGCRPSP